MMPTPIDTGHDKVVVVPCQEFAMERYLARFQKADASHRRFGLHHTGMPLFQRMVTML
jgi:hypothetical protein